MTHSNGSSPQRWDDTRLDRFASTTEAAIQALSRDVAQMVQTHTEFMASQQEINQRLADVQEGLAGVAANIDQTQPTILQKLNSIQGKLDELLRRNGL